MVSRSKQNRKTNLKYSRRNRQIMSGGMNILVRLFNNTAVELEVDPNDTISTLRNIVAQKQGCQVNQVRLIYSGKELQDQYTLADYGIIDDSSINTALRLGAPAECVDCSHTKPNTVSIDYLLNCCAAPASENIGQLVRDSEARVGSNIDTLGLMRKIDTLTAENTRLRAQIDTLKMKQEQDKETISELQFYKEHYTKLMYE